MGINPGGDGRNRAPTAAEVAARALNDPGNTGVREKPVGLPKSNTRKESIPPPSIKARLSARPPPQGGQPDLVEDATTDHGPDDDDDQNQLDPLMAEWAKTDNLLAKHEDPTVALRREWWGKVIKGFEISAIATVVAGCMLAFGLLILPKLLLFGLEVRLDKLREYNDDLEHQLQDNQPAPQDKEGG